MLDMLTTPGVNNYPGRILPIMVYSGGSRPSDTEGGRGGGGVYPDPEIKGEPGLPKHFAALRASV